jgi:hypothetical protein
MKEEYLPQTVLLLLPEGAELPGEVEAGLL